ncbi:MAG: hypothetical protein QOF77_1160, partial [Solirubrobacteraceae bacterium]|nr:hypothetical protein [Solirubrobacteraceae bacterium]
PPHPNPKRHPTPHQTNRTSNPHHPTPHRRTHNHPTRRRHKRTARRQLSLRQPQNRRRQPVAGGDDRMIARMRRAGPRAVARGSPEGGVRPGREDRRLSLDLVPDRGCQRRGRRGVRAPIDRRGRVAGRSRGRRLGGAGGRIGGCGRRARRGRRSRGGVSAGGRGAGRRRRPGRLAGRRRRGGAAVLRRSGGGRRGGTGGADAENENDERHERHERVGRGEAGGSLGDRSQGEGGGEVFGGTLAGRLPLETLNPAFRLSLNPALRPPRGPKPNHGCG